MYGEISYAILIFIIGLIVGWNTREGRMILLVAILIPILKFGIILITESPYKQLEKKVNNVIEEVSRKVYILEPTNLLIKFPTSLFKQYLEENLEQLTGKIKRVKAMEDITVYPDELYRMIRFMTENKKTETILSLDLMWRRWLGIFTKQDYMDIGLDLCTADSQVRKNHEDKWLDDTTMLYEINRNRLTDSSDKLKVKRIFAIDQEGDCAALEFKQMLAKICDLQKKAGKNRMETKILVKENSEAEIRDILSHLCDIVIFNEEILFKEIPRAQTGHSVILRPQDVNDYIKKFLKLWDSKKDAIPVEDFLKQYK